MKLSIPVTVVVDIELDISDDDVGDFDIKDPAVILAITEEAKEAIIGAINDTDIADTMVENVTDNTGWCVKALSLTTV